MIHRMLFKISELLVIFGHNRLLLNIRNVILNFIGLKIEKGAGIDRGFDCLHFNNILIGEGTIIGINNHFWNYDSINIGMYCMFSSDITLINGSHDINTFKPESRPLTIGHGCWIGHGVKIIKGVTIGNNVIIGGGSVVIDDIPDNAIAVGVPAKVIKYRELPDKVWHLGNEYFCPRTFELIQGNK